MVAVKIICGCGQKYAFDVYPLNGRMPALVQCPVCGMDGTAVANEVIARTLGTQPVPPAPQPVPALNNPAVKEGKKDNWKWWQHLLAGWRGSRLIASTRAAGSELPVPDDAWRQRALMAEQRAEQAQAVVGASLAPHLAQALKEALVQELAVQRRELLQAQQIAAAELAQLTHHLDKLLAELGSLPAQCSLRGNGEVSEREKTFRHAEACPTSLGRQRGVVHQRDGVAQGRLPDFGRQQGGQFGFAALRSGERRAGE